MTDVSGARGRSTRSATAERATIGRLLDEAEARLEKGGVEFPDASALWLLAAIVGDLDDPDALENRRRQPVTDADQGRFWELVARRETHEPYAYIVGGFDFRGGFMEIENGVFVPREQTERMCDEIEAWAKARPTPADGWHIADLGSGSGAMAVSLARGPMKPRTVVAVDIAEPALALVRRNARRHGVSNAVSPLAADWLSAFRPEPCLDVICAVPPYLNPGDEIWLSDESVLWEPKGAFFGEPSGDAVLRRILDEAATYLRPGGLVALQADSDQIAGLVDHVNDDPRHPLVVEWILMDEDGDEDAILAVKP